ncbi:type III-B CRISPR module-associated Cmr3 family protein, partial [Myxococcus sp. 1LA]
MGRGYSLPWPLPTTVRGALRAAWGHDVMATRRTALSPEAWERDSEPVKLQRLVALRRALGETSFTQAHRMWPAPADAVRVLDTEGVERQVRLEPHPGGASTLGPDDDDAREALWHPRRSASGKPLPSPLFWPESRMVAWLSGAPDASMPEREAPPPRTDIHLAIDVETQASQDSMLHSREVVEWLRVQSRDSGRSRWRSGRSACPARGRTRRAGCLAARWAWADGAACRTWSGWTRTSSPCRKRWPGRRAACAWCWP